ncbi:hypothetical protein ACWDY7_33065 [Streptomyces calvus]|uniref:Uncharacterized protein n=1 Tax=Streptomyces calvus TaxID=67282 RepID=A0AA40SKQ4_9ACTN|nr:hypothetical protein [Streptomyces calvus]MBA8948249.1 hypothetical protein [Streptomyces calvus]GGP84391.1 hypothetical protein GCM10010247_67110 [Streptomyces calvus]
MTDIYTVAGRNIRRLTAQWLSEIENPAPSRSTLLDYANHEDDPDRNFFGASYVMQNIAPRVWGEDGSDDELLLFAVIMSYGLARPEPEWKDCATYVKEAFEYVHGIGEKEAARRIRERVMREATRERDHADQMVEELRRSSLKNDPGRIAAHERELAKGNHRDLRAAKALDPDGEIDFW